MRDYYCAVVLRYDRRWNLDGEETAETVDEFARTTTTQKLAVLAERRKARQAEQKKVADGGNVKSCTATATSLEVA